MVSGWLSRRRFDRSFVLLSASTSSYRVIQWACNVLSKYKLSLGELMSSLSMTRTLLTGQNSGLDIYPVRIAWTGYFSRRSTRWILLNPNRFRLAPVKVLILFHRSNEGSLLSFLC
jgi:hypothetical protein